MRILSVLLAALLVIAVLDEVVKAELEIPGLMGFTDLSEFPAEGLDELGGKPQEIDIMDIAEKSNEETIGLKKFLIDTGFAYAFSWGARLVYVRNKDERIFDTSLSKWWDNITQAPEVDDGDNFGTNFINHPLYGATAYLYYRSFGYGIWASALGSFVQSFLFEYGIEGLVETPSLIDLLATPGLGVPAGFGMEKSSDWLIKRNNPVAKTLAYIINPTRMFVHEKKVNLLNPLTGSFVFRVPFSPTPLEARGLGLSYPFSLEPPFSIGRLGGDFEVVNLDDGGEFIFYSLRLEFPSSTNRFGVYIKVPFAGINNVSSGGDDDGFELGNTQIGGKLTFVDFAPFAAAGGIEVILPTAYKDNRDRLSRVIAYGRDFPLYLRSAVTATPYVSAAVQKKGFSLQGNVGLDLITNAKNLEGDTLETRIKFGAAAGVGLSSLLPSPSLFVELNAFTLASRREGEKNDLFLTPGIRFGNKYSPGFGVQIPLAGATEDIANADFIFDFQARF